MDLWLIRHAEAVPRDPARHDARRPLTEKGRKRWVRSVRGLARLGVDFDHLYHSPMLRALETADVLMRLVHGERVVLSGLAEAPEDAMLAEFGGEHVAVVGHEPWLSQLLSLLLTGAPAEAERFELKKGAAAHLAGEAKPGGMKLVELLSPRALRTLAHSK